MNIDKLSKLTRFNNLEQQYLNIYDPWKIVEEEKEKVV